MATFKFTFLFDWQRRAGWTETFYKTIDGTVSGTDIVNAATAWAQQRARVLTAAATILACRSSDVSLPRRVRITELGLPGALGQGLVFTNIQPDVVNVAQLVTFNSDGEERRFYLMRGLDDRDVIDGQITFAENGRARYNRFWMFLQDNAWRMKDFVKSEQQEVLTVDGAGKKAEIFNAANYGRGDIVLIQSRTVGQGLKMRWQGKLDGKVANTVQLKGYRFGDAEGGNIWKLTATYPDLTNFSIHTPNWARTRQTGRPFDLPRGRAPKRT